MKLILKLNNHNQKRRAAMTDRNLETKEDYKMLEARRKALIRIATLLDKLQVGDRIIVLKTLWEMYKP